MRAITLEQSSIDYALTHGLIAEGTTEVDADMIADSGLIVFALYPHVFLDWVERYQHLLAPGTILTDVTGVKGSVVGKIQSMLCPDVEFIAAHPMAGREVSGVENSNADNFRDLTRIARINDLMWSELFMNNQALLLEQMDLFAERFAQLRDYLATGNVDGMRQMMRHSTEQRARFDKPKM